MLEIQHISKHYYGRDGVVHALVNVSLHIESGEFVCVQGPSGCGKTTLLLSAGGLLPPDDGQLIIDSHNLYNMSSDNRAHYRATHIGFVFQQFYLIPYLSVLENVLSPSLALQQDGIEKRARELIDHFQLTNRIDHVPGELSTGERQRTALARAILNNPSILLADEPTGNLDNENAEIVLGYFVNFAEAGGVVLMVTHSNEAASFAHKSIMMKNGNLYQSG